MNDKKAILIISTVFFLSGCSALIFETVWFRVAGTVLGSSVWSAAAVLMAFMGGLAIGNGLMANYGHKVNNPARYYLTIEAVIGVSGFVVILLLPIISPLVGSLLADLSEEQGILSVGRFVVACLFLILPATAIGATLPVMQKLLKQYEGSFINSISRLYGWNTIGAVFGVLITEFILIRYVGIISAAAIACVLNFIVVLIMLKYFSKKGKVVDKNEKGKLQKNISRYLLSAFFAGLLLLALEIVWFRYLLVAREASSLVFAVMLAVVLAGIGLGGLLVSRLKLQANHIGQLTWLAPIIASLATLAGYYLFYWYFDLYLLEIRSHIFYFVVGASLLIFPTSLISGMIFPLLGECIYRKNRITTSSSGYLTLANTIGAFVGSAIASFYLLPQLGIEYSMLVIVLAYLLVSLLLIERKKIQVISVFVMVLVIITIFPRGLMIKSFDRVYSYAYSGTKVVAFHEGLNQTIAYLETTSLGQRSSVRLVTNNHSMSGTSLPAQRYMRLYSYLPYLLPGKINDVLQISYGVGTTAESVIMLPDLKHFDLVELSPNILEMSHVVHDGTGFYPLRDERTSAHVEDGRFFLQTTRSKYDLITAEPPPPKLAGVVNLYTQEYFQLIYDALKPQGVTSYWLPLHSLTELDALAVIKAFCNVFQDCSLWDGSALDFMLIGSKSGLGKINRQQLLDKWTPKMAQEFSKLGFDSSEQVFATFIGDPDYLRQITKYINPVTDNYPARISTVHPNVREANALYSDFYDINKRKERFVNSNYIKNIFSDDLISTINKEFSREGIVTSTFYSPVYNYVLLDKEYNKWEQMLGAMSNKKRDFLLLRFSGVTPVETEIMDDVFSSPTAKTTYPFEYIKYLFLDKKYKSLDIEVKKFVNDDSVSHADRYEAYQYYLLSKLYLKTANTKDILKSLELAGAKQVDGFNFWYMKKVLKEEVETID